MSIAILCIALLGTVMIGRCSKFIVFFLALMTGCTFKDSAQEKGSGVSDIELADGMFVADPTIFEFEGSFYLYGTDGVNPDAGFKVYRSGDMSQWSGAVGVNNGLALRKEDVFGDRGFWAPQVWHKDGVFYMAYTANENIAIATSSSPIGPFEQKNKVPLIASGKQIDPFVFHDTDGKAYLYHVRLDRGNRIFVAEMSADYGHVISSTLQECIAATEDWENTENSEWPVAEGPTVLKVENRYLLFYSANDFRNKDYSIGVAYSDNPYGPWQKSSQNPLLSQQNSGYAGTGHGDVFKSGDEWYYVCHTHYSDEKVGPRRTAIIPFDLSMDARPKVDFDASKFRFLQIAE